MYYKSRLCKINKWLLLIELPERHYHHYNELDRKKLGLFDLLEWLPYYHILENKLKFSLHSKFTTLVHKNLKQCCNSGYHKTHRKPNSLEIG